MPRQAGAVDDRPGGDQAERARPDRGAAARDDLYLQVELIVGRLTRLVLGAQALAERPPTAHPGGAVRTQRLEAGILLARRALASAAVIDLDALLAGLHPFDRREQERRASERRGHERRVGVGRTGPLG